MSRAPIPRHPDDRFDRINYAVIQPSQNVQPGSCPRCGLLGHAVCAILGFGFGWLIVRERP